MCHKLFLNLFLPRKTINRMKHSYNTLFYGKTQLGFGDLGFGDCHRWYFKSAEYISCVDRLADTVSLMEFGDSP